MKITALVISTIVLVLSINSVNAGVNIFGSYNNILKASTSGTAFTPGPTAFTQTDTIGSGIAVGAEYFDKFSESLGFFVGGSYEPARTITKSDNSISGVSTASSPQPTIQVMTLYGNIAFYFSPQIYISGGLNYSMPSYTRGSSGNLNATLSSAMGAQLGVGYMINEQ